MDEELHELAERSRRREKIEKLMERKKQIKWITYAEKKIFKLQNSRNFGIILIIAGVGFAVIGAILAIINATNYLRAGYLMLLFFGYIVMEFGRSIISNSEKVGKY